MSRQLALGAFQRTKEPGKRAAGDSDACFWPKSHILKVRGSMFDLKTLICTELIRSLPRIDIFEIAYGHLLSTSNLFKLQLTSTSP